MRKSFEIDKYPGDYKFINIYEMYILDGQIFDEINEMMRKYGWENVSQIFVKSLVEYEDTEMFETKHKTFIYWNGVQSRDLTGKVKYAWVNHKQTPWDFEFRNIPCTCKELAENPQWILEAMEERAIFHLRWNQIPEEEQQAMDLRLMEIHLQQEAEGRLQKGESVLARP